MVSQYDIFFVIASKGEIRIVDILKALNKPKEEYQNIFNNVLELEKKGFVKRSINIKVVHNDKSRKLFRLISFCINNNLNYNLIFKKNMLDFIKKSARKEFFIIQDIKIHPQTFSFYTTLLERYGFLLVISKKPLKCKLLRHHFLSDVLEFFGLDLEFYKPEQKSLIEPIKKELKKYRRNLKIHYTVIVEIENKEKINFIYASLNLEGNPLTLPETQKLIMEDIIPEKHTLFHIQEVTNYKKAVDIMIANVKARKKLDLNLILDYHKLAMNHIDEAGLIRKQNVRIKLNPNFKTCDWRLISLKLNELLITYGKFKSNDIKEIIKFVAYFHNEFQRIHPFIDGNSRISRLLMLHILRSYQIPILDFPIGYFDQYLDLTKRSLKRNDESFQYLIEEIILVNLKRLNNLV